MSYKPRSLFRLIEEINRSLFLPHIQRPFVWEEEQMLRRFDSLMRNYPIQTFSFGAQRTKLKHAGYAQVEWDADLSDFYEPNMSKQGIEKVFVSMVSSAYKRSTQLFTVPLPRQTINAPRRISIFRVVRSLMRGAYCINSISTEPLSLPWYRVADAIGRDGQRNAEEIAERINSAMDNSNATGQTSGRETAEQARDRARRIRRNSSQLFSLLRDDRHFWIQELDGVANEFPYSTILDIFVRVNSGGTKLDASDLMFAAMKEGWSEIEEVIEETTELLNGTNLEFDKTFPLKCLLSRVWARRRSLVGKVYGSRW